MVIFEIINHVDDKGEQDFAVLFLFHELGVFRREFAPTPDPLLKMHTRVVDDILRSATTVGAAISLSTPPESTATLAQPSLLAPGCPESLCLTRIFAQNMCMTHAASYHDADTQWEGRCSIDPFTVPLLHTYAMPRLSAVSSC